MSRINQDQMISRNDENIRDERDKIGNGKR